MSPAEARLWHDAVAQLKVQHMDERRATGDTGGVVFAGSSQILEGVRPSLAAPGFGRRAYNAALHRGFLPLTERWLLEEVLPRLEPQLVVLGLSVLDLTDHGVAQYEVVDRYDAALAKRPGRRAGVQRAVLGRSRLARRLAGRFGPSVDLADLSIGPEGEGLEFANATEYRLSDKKRAFIEDELLADYGTGPKCLGAVRRILRAVRASGAAVIVVGMPHTDELHPMLPGGAAAVEDARSSLCTVLDDEGVRIVEELLLMREHRWFADCIHFNGAGMHEGSRRLARAIESELSKVVRA
jgi:hypothetical protein